MKGKLKVFASLFALLCVLLGLTLCVGAEDGKLVNESGTAIGTINDLQWWATNGGSTNFSLTGDYTLTNGTSGGWMNVSGKEIVIDGNGHTLTFETWFVLQTGKVTFKNITIKSGDSAQEAAIVMRGGTVVLSDGAVIADNSAAASGAVKVDSGAFIMNSATAAIKNCTGSWGAGAIYLQGGTAEISAGTIESSTATGGYGAIRATGGTLTISGGEIKNSGSGNGALYMKGGTLILSGDATVTDNGDINILLEDASRLTLGAFTGSAKVTLSGTDEITEDVAIGTAGSDASGAENILWDKNAEVKGKISDGTIYLSAPASVAGKLVNESGTAIGTINDLQWWATNGGSTNFSLTGDYTLTNGTSGGWMNVSGKEIVIDGNGHTLTFETFFVLQTGKVTFKNITIKSGDSTQEAAIVMRGGTVVLSDGAVIADNSAAASGAVKVDSGAFIMNSSTAAIKNCTGSWGSGAIYLQGGTAEISAGTIENSTATGGYGAIRATGGTLTISGGEIKSSGSNNGAVYMKGGTLILSGDATVTDNGEINILLEDASRLTLGAFTGSAKVTLSGTDEITEDVAIGTAGSDASGAENILWDKNAEVKGKISDGTIYLSAPASVEGKLVNETNVAIGTISDLQYWATTGGSTNFSLTGDYTLGKGTTSGWMTISGKEIVIDGNGHTLTFETHFELAGGKVTFKNITLKSGDSTKEAAIIVKGGTVVLSDGAVIADNSAAASGAVKVDSGAFIMNSATAAIKNCTGSWGSGAIYLQGGTAEISAGTIENSTATGGYGAIRATGGTLTISGGEIKNSGSNNGAVYMKGGTLILSGDATVTDNGEINILLEDASRLTLGAFTGSAKVTLSGTNTIEKLAEIGITGEGASGAKNISWDKDNTFKGKIKDGKLYLSAPVAISLRDDSGVYEDGTGVIRIITTFNKLPDADDIVSFGTWILPLSKFSESEFDSKKGEGLFVKTEIDTAKLIEGSSYHVDLTNIPKDALSGDVIAISFVKLSDSETVTTAKYIVKGVNADNRLKSE